MITLSFKTVKTVINGQTLEYQDIFSPVVNIVEVKPEDAVDLFRKTKQLFDEAGIQFALTFGSLLGAVREGGLIKGDEDVDLCIWDEDKLLNNIIPLYQKGLKVCRMDRGYLYSFKMDDRCYIDVYILRKFRGLKRFPWSLYCLSINGCAVPKKFFTGWQEIEFAGEKCLCPEHPERLLEFWYGSDWRIPQNKKGIYNVRPVEFIVRCKKRFVAFVARILRIK